MTIIIFCVNILRGGGGLLQFNKYYFENIREIFNCNYFVTNSRLYTRMAFINLGRLRKIFPHTNFIAIHHHSNYLNHSGALKLIHKYLELKVLRNASSLIIPNRYVIDQLGHDFGIKNIVNLPSSFVKKSYELSSLDNGRLLFVGTIERRKGIIYGLEAFKVIHGRLPEYKYHIAGDYSNNMKYYALLKKYVRENNLEDSVIFEGRISSERLDWLYSHSDLLLFPSLLEGYGMVIPEAMARGVPVAAFNNSAMPYTVKDGINGIIAENKNSEMMADKVVAVLKDRNRMKFLQQGALKTFADVPDIKTLNDMTRDYINTWK